MNALDRLARATADVPSGVESRLTRRDFAARGLLGLLALGFSSRLGLPAVAEAATTPCRSLATCLKRAESAAVDAFWQCQGTKGQEWSGPGGEWAIESLACRLWTYQPKVRQAQRACLEKCPPPPKGPRPKKPPRRAPAPPPALPPNPYGPITDECTNCMSVGGKCCYGQDPLHLCACGHPDPAYDCAGRYGCG